MNFLSFLEKNRPTEEDILIKNIKSDYSVLDVAPYVYNNLLLDPSLIILLKKINCKKLTIIDIKGNVSRDSDFINRDAQKYRVGSSDLFRTREYIKSLTNDNVKFVLSDALLTPFTNESFDIILDRVTHEFIIFLATDLLSGDKIDKMIYEYNRILKRGGKIILFTNRNNRKLHRLLIDKLKMWNYDIASGKLRRIRDFIFAWRNVF